NTPITNQFGDDPLNEILSPFVPPAYQDGGAFQERKVRIGGGSGFLVSDDGVILTNKHVVSAEDATYEVVTGEEKTHPVKILGRDPLNDVAILKIEGRSYPYIHLGNSSTVRLGQPVIAIGNVLGEFQNSVSHGIISGLSRYLSAEPEYGDVAEQLRGVIQTDASINPGNSGGPLINMSGEAIAVNAAVLFGAENIGFAIPINNAKRDLEDVHTHGRIRTPYLGLRYLLLSDELARRNNFPLNYGALVVREGIPGDNAVVPGSPAARAGIQEFDIVLECNDERIDMKHSIQDILRKSSVGDHLHFKVLRNGKELLKRVKLAERS
ncbi:MAG: trypsin-like peptidase domain-containing protein, partial [Parcubacteria group bacterium]|nr:trypsin-like peptidase domain-containing protein [Parcubacteria group bacterium]